MFDGAFKNALCTEDNNILLRWLLECCLEIISKVTGISIGQIQFL